jgi:hypothetical protein
MKYIKLFENHNKIKLSDLYNEHPHQDELIWEFVTEDEFDSKHFETSVCNPQIIFEQWGIKDMYEEADEVQTELIDNYRNNIAEIKESIIIIDSDSNILIDGYHRIVALYLEGVDKIQCVDLFNQF